MKVIVPRTCTEIPPRKEQRNQPGDERSRPLEEFRDAPAYVLLGDPGAGKTTAFEAECEALGEQALKIPARDFLAFDPQHHPEWRGKILFIDGLDEIRAGTSNVGTPFDQVRRKLDALGKPRFRLSCREADWLGENDQKHLESVSPDSPLRVLRLYPLTDTDVTSILDARAEIGDAGAFIEEARKRGVEGLLENPQTLEMLADVVGGGGGWPESRKETFEMASGQMVLEHNEEHQASQESGSSPPHDQLLDAAGRLCALQLISGGAGYTLRGQPDEEYPALDKCDYDPQVLRSALATKLFKGASSNRFIPVHRHVAEFLGARHLARVVQNGLPARRVISLITGEDGTVVTEMRGLSAWLAANSREARPDLIERDPIGVGLYGEIGEFSVDEKRALLKSLKREGARLGTVRRSAEAFGALATSEMEVDLSEALRDSDRSPDHQMFTDFVLRVLTEGKPLSDLGVLLIATARDDTRWPRVNASALNAFIHNCPESQGKADNFKSLLADIRNRRVSDPDNELLGILLNELYPKHLSPSQVCDIYFETRHRESFFGMYKWFFWFALLEKSSDDQIAELLDTLGERPADTHPTLKGSSTLENLPVKLLARGLQVHGDRLATERLYDWLNLGFTEDLDEIQVGDMEDIQEIRSWLEQRPKVQKVLVIKGLERCLESDGFSPHVIEISERWYGSSLPSDFGLWCLKQAVSMEGSKREIAEHLFELAVSAHASQNGNEGLSLEVLQDHAEKREWLKPKLDQLLAPRSITPRQQRLRERARTFTEERRLREEQWLELIRSNEVALRENRAAPALLEQIAIRYFGNSINVHRQGGPKDIEQELEDPNLIDAAIMGIRGVVDRKDVPGDEEILALRATDRRHYLGFPFLAALSEFERSSPEELCRLDEGQMRKALAFHFSLSSSIEPNWYQRLLDSEPGIVAHVMILSGKVELRGGRKLTGLFALAHRENHAQVARHASMPLLRAFPTRCKLHQIENLKHLLWAALQHADRSALQELIGMKLSRKSMNDAQRVRWLALGVIVSPARYKALLSDFAEGNERRISNLAEFFSFQDPIRFSFDDLGIPVLELLIRLVGTCVGPDQRRVGNADDDEGGFVGPEMEAAWLVYGQIQRLAASPTKESSHALCRLVADPELTNWHEELSRAQDAQRVICRDAGYRHLSIKQVCQTLNGGTPANAADLAALMVDRFDEIAERVSTNNANYWRPYWNEDESQRPTTPKHENSCRDALLQDLRRYFSNAEPEIQYVNNKRADIRVAYGDFQVPLEIKKNSHPDLWSAPRNQLIPKYTTDPETDGYGIYLVFWFGKEHTQVPPPSGTSPMNAKELKEQLKATLSPEEARKISVCVIDVSRPG